MGLITIGLAVITTNLDSQFQFQLSNVMGVLAGPILAVFLLGFFTTTANKYGAITGILVLSMSTYTKNYGNFILLIFKNELYFFNVFRNAMWKRIHNLAPNGIFSQNITQKSIQQITNLY